MEQTECSETLVYKIQTPGNYPEENIQHTEHGESLKSRIMCQHLFQQIMLSQRKIIPKYVNIKIVNTPSAAQVMAKKAHITRIKDEIKFLYRKKFLYIV
jgi:hypothetical protein